MDAGQMLFSMSVKNLTELQAVKRCFIPPLSSEIRRKRPCGCLAGGAVRLWQKREVLPPKLKGLKATVEEPFCAGAV